MNSNNEMKIENGVLIVSGKKIPEIALAISSKTRLEILKRIQNREVDVEELAKTLEQSRANTSAQLRVLEKAGLVKTIYKPGIRGVKKICTSDIREIVFKLI
ncbi:MAG: ArsR family transcriptional regulator [Candidatus Methanomethylicia archaeon]|nr:ArsR family transcriptional regulator [Candidatus Methanomethylicia archaeon]